MANDNDFVKRKLGDLREPEGFQPDAARARVRLLARKVPRAGGWKWAAIPATAVFLLAMVHPVSTAVARMDDNPGGGWQHVHYFLRAHWNGIVRIFQHIPWGNDNSQVIAKNLKPGEPFRPAEFTPRPAPEFKIVDPSGRETLLSAQKGKVVVVQFLYTWCGHCENTAAWLSKVKQEFGPQGLEVFGVAFNEEVNTPDGSRNLAETSRFAAKAAFPVGLSAKGPVLDFLGIPADGAYGVPQMVVIDRQGVIQGQTSARPKQGEVFEEPVLRGLVAKLLAER